MNIHDYSMALAQTSAEIWASRGPARIYAYVVPSRPGHPGYVELLEEEEEPEDVSAQILDPRPLPMNTDTEGLARWFYTRLRRAPILDPT